MPRALRSPACLGRAGGVFDLVGRLLDTPQTGVDGNVGLGADLGAKGHELVQAEVVVLDIIPCPLPARRPPVAVADAVLPVVAGDEVAPGPARDGRIELLDQPNTSARMPLMLSAGISDKQPSHTKPGRVR